VRAETSYDNEPRQTTSDPKPRPKRHEANDDEHRHNHASTPNEPDEFNQNPNPANREKTRGTPRFRRPTLQTTRRRVDPTERGKTRKTTHEGPPTELFGEAPSRKPARLEDVAAERGAAIEKVESRLTLPPAPADDDERRRLRTESAGKFAPDLESEEVVLAGLDGRADHEIGPTVGCTARSLEKGLFHSEWRDRHGRAREAGASTMG
jgi:hypothetical protein